MELVFSNNILTQSHSQEAWHAFGKNDTGQQGQQSPPASQPAYFVQNFKKAINIHYLLFLLCARQ